MKSEVKVAQLCPLFATPWAIQSMEFSRPEHWSGEPFPSPGDLPNPGNEPRSPALQADSLPAEPPGKPAAIGASYYSHHHLYLTCEKAEVQRAETTCSNSTSCQW